MPLEALPPILRDPAPWLVYAVLIVISL